jgi:hypothetical protein
MDKDTEVLAKELRSIKCALYICAVVVSLMVSYGANANEIDQEAAKKEIFELMETFSSCENDSQCELVYPGCPFGCATGINRDGVSAVQQEIERYAEEFGPLCVYKCKGGATTRCVNNSCIVEYP